MTPSQLINAKIHPIHGGFYSRKVDDNSIRQREERRGKKRLCEI